MPDFISLRASDNLDTIARILGVGSGRDERRADRASAFTVEFKQPSSLRLSTVAPSRAVRSISADPGSMSWHELRSPAPEASAAFLADLIDGDTATHARLSSREYSTVLSDGLHVAGCARCGPDERASWETFVRVPDVDLLCAMALEEGGSVAVAPHGIAGLDRRATIVDPTGAALTVIAGGDDRRTVGAGALGWDELRSTDPMASVRFWCAVFNWTAEPVLGDRGSRSVLFLNGGRAVASLVEAGPFEPSSRWVPVVTVRQGLVHDAVRRAILAGARLLVPPGAHGVLGAAAVILDPHGMEVVIGGEPAVG
jgi:predicted enzyme related to lactoylglutathione lyase